MEIKHIAQRSNGLVKQIWESLVRVAEKAMDVLRTQRDRAMEILTFQENGGI